MTMSSLLCALACAMCPSVAPQAPSSFVNWESAHVHPLELVPGGARLLAVNTPDNRLEVFELGSGKPVRAFDVPVGLDPVSVRACSARLVWVVNQISDSISVVDLEQHNVVATLRTDDQPADVVFAGEPRRAFVSCSQSNTVLVFDPEHLDAAPQRIAIDGESPRALAVSNDGKTVYAAIFESGNGSTLLAGGSEFNIDFPPNVVNRPVGPYSGRNPPPNSAKQGGFEPAQRAGNPPPPKVGLIVKRNAAGEWRDDYLGDWTNFVSGANAALSGRVPGWDLADNDIAILDTHSLSLHYARHLMNTCMALAVHPKSGEVSLVGTDATNEVRFEPVLSGKFLRVRIARVDAAGAMLSIGDLNPHLDYQHSRIEPSERHKSLGDPRALVWNASGSKGYVAGMGSNNVVVIGADGARLADSAPIDVGEGPTGLALDEARAQLYVLCKFASEIRVVSTEKHTQSARVPFHDPSPAAIRVGRRHLYDTHENSGLGQIACASCHVDARIDHLAWDLGDPSGTMVELGQGNLGAKNPALLTALVPGRGDFKPYHPMKGPMSTQTLQDIIGKEPHHWRGDRTGLEGFAGAFQTLQGDDHDLAPKELQEFEDFLATIALPPNPLRGFDNALPEDLALPGHLSTGRFGPAGKPLPNGNARHGLQLYRSGKLDNLKVDCVTCHTLPSGVGPDAALVGNAYVALATGKDGEHHHMLVAQDGSSNVTMKVPQLRNLYEKVGCNLSASGSHFGFGFLHDGSVDTLARFVNEASFTLASDQDTADLVAFLLCFSGSDFGPGSASEPPGPASKDTHAAVGWQVTLAGGAAPARMLSLADAGRVGLVVKGRSKGLARGWFYVGGGRFQSDRKSESETGPELAALAGVGSELTYTLVPLGTAQRIGVDRDEDGVFDRDELDAGCDPADGANRPL